MAIGCAVVVASIASANAPAYAQTATPRVGVIVRGAADPPVDADRVRAALATAVDFGALTDPLAVALARLDAQVVREARLALFARAEQLADEGWRGYLAVEIAYAEARLVEARRVATSVLDVPGGAELVADIALRLGAVRLSLARPEEAAAAFRLAAALDPHRVVSVASFAPDVVTAYERAGAPEMPRVAVRVAVTPADATLWIDGQRVEPTAGVVSASAGQHGLVVTAPGFVAHTAIVDVPAVGEVAPWELVLEPDPLRSALVRDGFLRPGQSERAGRVAVEALMIFAELDALVIAAPVWRFEAPAILAQRCAGVPVRCGPVIELAFGDERALVAAARAAWASIADPAREAPFETPTLLVDRRLVAGETRPVDRPPPPRRSWYKSGWLWVAVSGVAVGVTAAVLFGGGGGGSDMAAINPCEFGGPMCP